LQWYYWLLHLLLHVIKGLAVQISSKMIQWQELVDINQLEDIDNLSRNQKVLIFKHSTRCSISTMAKNRLENDWDLDCGIIPFYLDLIQFRNISGEIEIKYNVYHESPQILLIDNGNSVMELSHLDISFENISHKTSN